MIQLNFCLYFITMEETSVFSEIVYLFLSEK